MRGQFAGAVLLGIVADFANGGWIEPTRRLFHTLAVIVYDFELGVIVRCHWCPPWQDRHYFRALRRPRVDRREVMPTHRMQKPQKFYRYWSRPI